MTSLPALDVRGLVVRLGGATVLDQIDLRVAIGELIGLIGPNGAGKTTLLRTLLGLVRASAGRVEVLGGEVDARRDLIGYVPQRHQFDWDFPVTVRGAIGAGRLRGILRPPKGGRNREPVDRALDAVGLTALAERPIGALSGGQRQRVLVARALVREPRIMLLDEPFSGVDGPSQEMLEALLGEFVLEGGTVVMTTHDLRAAARMCARLCLLNRRLVACGTPDVLAGSVLRDEASEHSWSMYAALPGTR